MCFVLVRFLLFISKYKWCTTHGLKTLRIAGPEIATDCSWSIFQVQWLMALLQILWLKTCREWLLLSVKRVLLFPCVEVHYGINAMPLTLMVYSCCTCTSKVPQWSAAAESSFSEHNKLSLSSSMVDKTQQFWYNSIVSNTTIHPDVSSSTILILLLSVVTVNCQVIAKHIHLDHPRCSWIMKASLITLAFWQFDAGILVSNNSSFPTPLTQTITPEKPLMLMDSNHLQNNMLQIFPRRTF